MIRKSARASYTKNEIRGCVDLGSSFFRLLVVDGAFPDRGASAEPGRSKAEAPPLLSFREDRRYVGWGEDLVARGAVTRERLSRATGALLELVGIARGWGCGRPYLVGTNTLREAKNAPAVIATLEAAVREPVRVLSQYEEAAFGFAGAVSSRDRDETICLFDVGGTSSEVSWGKGGAVHGFRGVPWGTHRVHTILDGASGARRAALVLSRAVDAGAGGRPAKPGSAYPLPPASEEPTILVTGGTAVSLVIVLRYMRGEVASFEEGRLVTLDDVALARRRVAGLVHAGRERSLPLDRERTTLLPAGLILLEALLAAAGTPSFTVTARNLRWGVALTKGVVPTGTGVADG